MKFWAGLAIGAALGAAGMYLGLRAPWRGAAAPPPVAVVDAPIDAGVAAPPSKKKKGRRVATTTSGATVSREVDDEVVLTDADRRIEARGDAVALPPRTLDLTTSGGDDGRALDDGEIASGLASGDRAMVACITESAGSAPLSGEVSMQLLVGGDGKVDKVRVRAPAYLHDHGLYACAKRMTRSLAFARTGAPTVVTQTYGLN